MKIKNILRILLSYPKKYTVSAIIILIVVAGYFYFTSSDKDNFEYIITEKSDLRQEVSVTGKVKPASKVDLAFESGGKVSRVSIEVGDLVYSGQRLASLNNSQYQAQYNQAKASLEVEKIKLDELNRGTRIEEINIQKVKVKNAEQTLSDAKNNLVVKIKDSFTKSDDAVRNQVDQLFNNPFSTSPDLNFTTGSILESKVESERFNIEGILVSWIDIISRDENIFNELYSQTGTAKQNLNKISSFLDDIALAVNGMNITTTLTQIIIDGYKADINIARTNVNTAISNLSAAEEKLRTAESNLLLEQQQLVLKESGATTEQIRVQESKVASAEANVDNYKAIIAKTIIYSPIKGIVTKKEIEVGEIVQMNINVVTVISEGEFEIEANIPEADIAKVNINDIAQITLDAYEDEDIFEARIISIEPAETIIEGVSTYKTVFQFIEKDERIRSGMTANIDILTGMRENVISIPARLLRINGNTHIRVLEDGTIVERIIETGMRSTDGRVEIVSGLQEGDKVITSK